MSLSLENKVNLTSLTVVIIAVSILVTLFNITSKTQILENEKKILSLYGDRQISYLQREISRIKQDLSFLSDSPYLSGIINQKYSNLTDNYRKSEEEFSRIINNREAYTQIRLIGIKNNGKEIIRVNKVGGIVSIVSSDNLQQKGQYAYFTESLKTPKDGYYISELEYNREHGVIETPKTPVIRISKTMYTDTGDLFGILIINVDFNKQLNHLSSYLDVGDHFVIKLPNGNYIFHLSGGAPYDFHNRLVDINKTEEAIQTNKPPVFFSEYIDTHDKGISAGDRIVVKKDLELAKDKHLSLMIGREVNRLNNSYVPFLLDTNYLSIPLLMIIILITVMISGIPLRQVSKVGEIIKGINKGTKQRHDLPVELNNEVGDLSRAFNTLLNNVEEKEKEIELAKEQLELAISGSSDGIWDWDVVNNRLEVSNRYKEMLGYGENDGFKEELDYLSKLIHPDDLSRLNDFTNSYFDGKTDNYEIEIRMRHRNGYYIDILSRGRAIRDNGGKVQRIVGTNTDITERKRQVSKMIAHEQLQKRALVKEVHHRIKNNLQGVASLLRQHSENSHMYKNELNSAISQVYAMAMVHGIQSKEVDGGIFILEMVKQITSVAQDLSDTKIEFEGDNDHCKYRFDEKEAVPMALVINELITNACKHSKNESKVQVSVVCYWCTDKTIILEIDNNVSSFPKDFSLSDKKGLGTGLDLVVSLLPPEGCSLSIKEEGGICRTQLILEEPVIFAESDWEYVGVKQA